MISIRDLCLVTLIYYFSNCAFSKDIDTPVSMKCFNCICQAATGCNFKQSCQEDSCGPFAFSKNYWIDANRPTVNRVPPSHPEAFSVCSHSLYCCFHTVERYMEKHKKDCNGDGKIDCDDFLAIHKFGPDKCGEELPEYYTDRYDYCQSLYREPQSN